jgi:hypothetical protein
MRGRTASVAGLSFRGTLGLVAAEGTAVPPGGPRHCTVRRCDSRMRIRKSSLATWARSAKQADAYGPRAEFDATLTAPPGDDRLAMGTVIALDQHRADKQSRAQEAADRGSRHPALRWVAGETFYIAHRKDGSGAACGADGDLMLAPPGVPLCSVCYPGRGSGRA